MNPKPTIHPIPVRGRLQCATYLINGPAGAVLIDPGSGEGEQDVIDGVRKVGRTLDEVPFCLLTHCHVDHALGAYRFRNRGMQLVASARTAEIMRVGGHQMWYEYPDYAIPTEVDLTPADGAVLDLCGIAIRVVCTPGHTDGCASYLVDTDAGLTAFTGDLITTSGQLGWSGSEGFSVADTLSSVEKLLALKPVRAFWGHGSIPRPACDWLRDGLALGRAGKWVVGKEFHPDITPPACLERRK